MNTSNPNADWFFEKESKWQKEYQLLRKICLGCGLSEEVKWGCPCYTFANANLVLIHGFKEYCALLFFKGALLNDAEGMLVQQTKNVQSARQMRFTSASQISQMQASVKACIFEAIEVEKAGLKVPLKKTSEYEVPEEFQTRLKKDADLKKAFKALTPGRQRAYLFYFSQAKQSKTREARIDKYVQHILDGKGLDD